MINYELIDSAWVERHQLKEENLSVIWKRLRSLANYLNDYCQPDDININIYKQGSDVKIHFNDDVCSYGGALHYSEGRFQNYGHHKYRY